MRTQEQIERDLFILDCKDHWNSGDWKTYSELQKELSPHLPKVRELTQQEKEAKEIASNEKLGLKYAGKDEHGAMIFVSTW